MVSVMPFVETSVGGSMTFRCGFGSISGSDSFLSDLKDAKRIFFRIFFYNLPAGTLCSVLKI